MNPLEYCLFFHVFNKQKQKVKCLFAAVIRVTQREKVYLLAPSAYTTQRRGNACN
jgi:hypothetical protein